MRPRGLLIAVAVALAAGAVPAAALGSGSAGGAGGGGPAPAALPGGAAIAGAAAVGACARRLPVAVRLPTRNARAFQRLGVVHAVAGARVRDLRVRIERHDRTLAHGARAGAFAGSAPVRLAFGRRARAGRVSVVVTGRRVGCAAKRTTRRALTLDRNDLPVTPSVADGDVDDGRFAITLRRTGARAVADLRVRVLDKRGETIAERTSAAPLGERRRLEFAPAARPAAGRYWLLVTADVQGERARGTVAGTIDLTVGPRATEGVSDPLPPPALAPPPPAPPSPGAIVQQVGVSWAGGRWEGADTAGFSLPGIGEGQIVCRPDTQWVRVFPADRSREVAMMLWTFRDWEGGSEGALREAQMTPFTGPDFNEGMNKFTPPEKRSHGTFTGVIGDGLPNAGTFGVGRAPTEIRLSWSWDFEDPAGARCSVSAALVSEGAGTVGAIARGLSLAWNGESGVPADATAATAVPGLGTARLRCDPRPDGVRQLVLEPQAPVPGLTATTWEGSVRTDAPLLDAPYVVSLPNNGLVELATPGGGTVRVLLASHWKVNDPDPGQNWCRLWGLAVNAGS